MIGGEHNGRARQTGIAAALFAAILVAPWQLKAQSGALSRSSAPARPAQAPAELVRLRADLIEKITESRAAAEKVLVLHQQQQARLKQDLERHRTLYEQGIISRAELDQVEHALSLSTARLEEDRRQIAESDLVITEVSFRDELARMPRLSSGAYNETGKVLRYNGAALWSLADSAKVEGFFARAFGYPLPISAFGQTSTHDRLRFDHRHAVDVALHPDSPEGRSLLTFLRDAGIPFIAFRSAAPGVATGAHIHIGRPSPRN
jgi:hypothetical protein